eukprot:s1435_g13.t1
MQGTKAEDIQRERAVNVTMHSREEGKREDEHEAVKQRDELSVSRDLEPLDGDELSVSRDLEPLDALLAHDYDLDSISAEPSLARSSQFDFSDQFVGIQTEQETATEVRTFDTDTALEVAARSIPLPSVEPIWEQGIWGLIFGEKSLLDVYKPYGETLKRPIDTSVSAATDLTSMPSSSRAKIAPELGLSFADVVRDKPDIPWQEQRDADLQSSVKFWMALADRWDSGCSLVTSAIELQDTGRTFTMFAHLFAGRSPITIRKRGYSIMRICDFLDGRDLLFPCAENAFYDFLCSEQLGGAPQSRMKGYMQSVNFVRHVMAVHELEPLTVSARCKGACLGEYLKERIQASPLKVAELRRIHDLLYSCQDVWVRLFCGALLMTTYCRARWGDLMRSESVITDYDHSGNLQYLEARTGRHKTMKSQMHRHQYLPMVAPCHGIDGKDWGSVWIEVRNRLEVAWPPEGLIMPAPGLQGEVLSRPLDTSECAAWLRKIVGCQEDASVRRVSSHLLKSTFLSYAAKRGAPEVVEVKDEPEVVELSDSDDVMESSSTSSEEPRPPVVKHTPVIQPTVIPEGFEMWQHRKLKTLHLMAVGNFKIFSCGRQTGAFHEKLSKPPEFDTPLCSLCFNRIHFESTTLVISTIREKVTSEGAEKGDVARKIPLAEKKQRREEQMTRLSGISMTGELDPSHSLLDLANQIHESGSIVWLAPSKCSKRDDEIQLSLKDTKSSVQIENSQLRVGPSVEVVEAEWNSELKYQWCMMRRGLALDQCRVLSWSVHQHWINYMLNLLSRPVNPGFQQMDISACRQYFLSSVLNKA